MNAMIAHHAGGNCREHQNAFQTLTKNKHGDIENRHGFARVRLCRIGSALGGDPLPDQYSEDNRRGQEENDLKSDPYELCRLEAFNPIRAVEGGKAELGVLHF
jgi:hypothetical protein